MRTYPSLRNAGQTQVLRPAEASRGLRPHGQGVLHVGPQDELTELRL